MGLKTKQKTHEIKNKTKTLKTKQKSWRMCERWTEEQKSTDQ